MHAQKEKGKKGVQVLGGGKSVGKAEVHTKSAGARYSDMNTEQDVASPAAAVLERRQRRTTPQKRKQVCSDSDARSERSPRRGPVASGPATMIL